MTNEVCGVCKCMLLEIDIASEMDKVQVGQDQLDI